MAQSLDMAQSAALPVEQYNYDIVRKFTIMAMVWAVIGMSVGVYIASELAWPFLNYDIPQLDFWAAAPGAYHAGHLRLRRVRVVRHLLLYCATDFPSALGLSLAGGVYVLGLASGRGAGRAQLCIGHHSGSRVR